MSKRKKDANTQPSQQNGGDTAADTVPASPLFAAKTRGIVILVVNHFEKHRKRSYWLMVLAGLPGWVLAALVVGLRMGWF